jgi:hypothetical protein
VRLTAHLGLLTLCALLGGFGLGTAHALDEVRNQQVVTNTAVGRYLCTAASLRANGFGPGEAGGGDTLSMYGAAYESSTCTPGVTHTPFYNAPGRIAIRWTLWKWNGSKAEICTNTTAWTYNKSADTNYAYISGRQGYWIASQACQDGHYNVGVESCIYKSNVWKCGTVFSGWQWADVSDVIVW